MKPFKILLVVGLLASAASLTPAVAPERPHSPWVFRSVLDERARMITVALHDELWVAYDATDGSLYQAWKGGVEFDGAVYTTRHGPQPTSEGTPYIRAESYPVGPWTTGGDAPKVRYLGYSRRGQDSVEIATQLTDSDGRPVTVYESPLVRFGAGGEVQLVRTFRVDGDSSQKVTVWMPTHQPDGTPLTMQTSASKTTPDRSHPNEVRDRWIGVILDRSKTTQVVLTLSSLENRP